jgi:hypothetical protein
VSENHSSASVNHVEASVPATRIKNASSFPQPPDEKLSTVLLEV